MSVRTAPITTPELALTHFSGLRLLNLFGNRIRKVFTSGVDKSLLIILTVFILVLSNSTSGLDICCQTAHQV